MTIHIITLVNKSSIFYWKTYPIHTNFLVCTPYTLTKKYEKKNSKKCTSTLSSVISMSKVTIQIHYLYMGRKKF